MALKDVANSRQVNASGIHGDQNGTLLHGMTVVVRLHRIKTGAS
jgi:hypothetical protein